MTWPATLRAGVSPGRFDAWDRLSTGDAGRYRELYVSMRVKLVGRDFENQPVGTKLWYVAYGNTRQENDAFLMLGGRGSVGALSRLKLRMYVSPSADEGAPAVHQNVAQHDLFWAGYWHHVEVYLNVGHPDRRDGVVRVWIDRRLVTDRRDVKFLDSRDDFVQGFFRWQWTPVWGGVGGARTRADQMQIDHIYISGVPVRPVPGIGGPP